MTIILTDHKPSDKRITVVFPDQYRTSVPSAHSLTLGQLRRLTENDFTPLYEIFPKKAASHLDNLYAEQLTELVMGWMKDSGTDPKEPQE